MKLFGDVEKRMEEIRSDSFYKPCIDLAEKLLDDARREPIPYFTYNEYMEFFKSGDRYMYEGRFRLPRIRLSMAFLLYLYYQKNEYLDEICDMIWVLSSFPTWCLPAHIANDWNADFSDYRGHIDLVAAEIGKEFAEIDYILGDKLPKEIRFVIKKELNDRIFDAFESRSYWWEPKTNNWSAVCGGSVGITYMCMAPERFPKVKDRILSAMDYFISSYGDDGCCTEGLSYWNYGFGYYIYFADALYRFTDGKEDIRHSEKIDKMAKFVQHGYLSKGVGISFSDCGRGCSFTNSGLLCYLAKNYEGFVLPQIEWGKCTTLRDFLWTDKEMMKKTTEPQKGMFFYDKTGWYINRKEKYSFAAKAGHNEEEHNHNDIGSFIFADRNKQILVDIGQMIYTRDNFNENRYKYLFNSSLGHSVPIIDGKEQPVGRQYYGTPVKADENEFSLEIHKAYEGDIPPIVRKFSLNENGIVITDSFENFAGHTVTERFVSFIKPEIKDGTVLIDNAVLKSDALPQITDVTLQRNNGAKETYYLLDYSFNGNRFELRAELI